MSENSISNKNININGKKNVSYSTDYHVNYLEDSQKLVPENERKYFEKNKYDNTSESDEDMTSYIKEDDKKNVTDQKNTSDMKPISYSDNMGNYGSNINKSIFEKTYDKSKDANENVNIEKDDKEVNDENKNFLNEEQDNYNELSPENQMLKKLDMLRKLGELAQYGVKLSQNYNMNSDYFTMKYEYELHKNIRAKQNFINWTSSVMLNCIYGVEILNDKYDPFSLKLTGWSEQINADISSYYDIFCEIYEKYNKPGKSMSPELRLILMLGGGALKFHLNKVALSNKVQPTYNMQTQQDPQLLEQMRNQAMLDRMKEDTIKQNEALKKKTDNEHTLANQQMQDMLFLQQKQKEIAEKEELNKKRMADFERIKMMMDSQNNMNNINNMNTINNANVKSSLYNNIHQQIDPRMHTRDTTYPEKQRLGEISNQLNEMKNNMRNKKVENEEETETNESKQTGSSTSNSTSSSKSKLNIKTSSKKEIDISQGDKSINSKTNASSFSKRKYKRSGISIDTEY